MKKYAIVTDSTTYFTEEQFKEFGIKRASLNVMDQEESLRELDIENSKIYELFDQGKRLTTSQPAPGEFLDIYEDLVEQGYETIFVMVIAEPLSGTYQSARLAINMLDNPEQVHIFHSNMAAYGNEMLLLELMDLIKQDLKKETIIQTMESYIKTAKLVLTNEDLISLIRSGRLSKTKAMIGQILRIKPVIKMNHGKLDLLSSARTQKKALQIMMDYMKEELKDGYKTLKVRVCSHNSLEYANKAIEAIKDTFENAEITLSEYIGPVFNVHVGPKGFGFSFMTE
jgi:DegV family protein with EDD domain